MYPSPNSLIVVARDNDTVPSVAVTIGVFVSLGWLAVQRNVTDVTTDLLPGQSHTLLRRCTVLQLCTTS